MAAEQVRSIVRLRTPTGSPTKDRSNRDKALANWQEIERLFSEWVPGGERVMLTKLHEWYHSQPDKV
jgi:hypothetical protein